MYGYVYLFINLVYPNFKSSWDHVSPFCLHPSKVLTDPSGPAAILAKLLRLTEKGRGQTQPSGQKNHTNTMTSDIRLQPKPKQHGLDLFYFPFVPTGVTPGSRTSLHCWAGSTSPLFHSHRKFTVVGLVPKEAHDWTYLKVPLWTSWEPPVLSQVCVEAV